MRLHFLNSAVIANSKMDYSMTFQTFSMTFSKFSMTLGLAVTFEYFQNFRSFQVFLTQLSLADTLVSTKAPAI